MNYRLTLNLKDTAAYENIFQVPLDNYIMSLTGWK